MIRTYCREFRRDGGFKRAVLLKLPSIERTVILDVLLKWTSCGFRHTVNVYVLWFSTRPVYPALSKAHPYSSSPSLAKT